MDRLIVARKLDSLRRCLDRVRERCPADVATLAGDADLQDIVVLNLSRAVQICVDLALHNHNRCSASTDRRRYSGQARCLSAHLMAAPELPARINAYTVNNMTYDPSKRKKNQRKHAIDLADCDPVFDGPMLTREDARTAYGEQRLVSLGWLKGRVVVLVWTDREYGPRMISCREAEPHEQEAYYRAYPPG